MPSEPPKPPVPNPPLAKPSVQYTVPAAAINSPFEVASAQPSTPAHDLDIPKFLSGNFEMGHVALGTGPLSIVEQIILKKHRRYNRLASFNRVLYYATRTLAGLAAGLLPFVINPSPTAATWLSITVLVAIVIDSVYKPGEKCKTYSRASDLLTVAELKSRGLYEQAKEMLDIVVATEATAVEKLTDLDEVLQKVKKLH